MLIEKIPIVPEIMRIDTRTQAIDMQQIGNRRFLFNPKTGVLVLGRQYQETSLVNASHAVGWQMRESQKILTILCGAGSGPVGTIPKG